MTQRPVQIQLGNNIYINSTTPTKMTRLHDATPPRWHASKMTRLHDDTPPRAPISDNIPQDIKTVHNVYTG